MKIREKLKLLSNGPGCYLMKNKNDDIIYVGKAKNLKSRVSSYFTGSHNYKTTKLVSEIIDFDVVLTNSEQESLILELNLIKQYRPKYNIVFMDDKTYPYIEITKTKPPVIRVVRTKKVKGNLYGPYPNVKSARETARFLELLFPMGKIEPIPNFYEEIGFKIEPDISNNYKNQVNIVHKFLKGDTKEIVNALKDEMNIASENLLFERALVLRDQINHIDNITEKQLISMNDYKDRDIIGFSYNEEEISLQILFMRQGQVRDQHQTIFSYIGNPKSFLLSYLNQFYEDYVPDEVLFSTIFNDDDIKSIKNSFIPKIGDKRKMVVLAEKNAKYDLENYNLIYKNKYQKIEESKEELINILNLDKLDLIEIFDNSQLFGTAPISAMVVYENNQFNKKLYRKFHLTKNTNDDYSSMKEVIYRRYYRVLVDNLKMPDLILVDGGIGQVNVANEIIESLGLNILVCGLKKNDKHRLESLVTINNEYKKEDYNKAFLLLNMFSEEVHRFAISFHRKTRDKSAISSPLDNIKGLGSVRKRVLMTEYKNIDEIKNASVDELVSLGIPLQVVNNLKEVLNDESDN